MDGLVNNAVVKTLAMDSPFEYGNEALLFLYVWQVADSNRTSKNLLSGIFLTLLRAFGSLYFVVPLVLGKVGQSDLFQNCDKYIQYFAGWWLLTFFAAKISGSDTLNHKGIEFLKRLSFSVFIANATVTAFEQGKEAFGDSQLAPLLVGYLGALGASVVENGLVKAVNGEARTGEFDKNQILATFGPLLFSFLTTGSLFGFALLDSAVTPVIVARVVVVLFRLSAEHVDYNEIIHYFEKIQAVIVKQMDKGVRAAARSIKIH